MPIYAYRCSACGHAQDVLQKMSDPRLVTCPECGKDAYEKQVTAAAFRLKGTGWYVTDFRGEGKPDAPPSASGEAASPGAATAVTAPVPAPGPAPATAAPPAAAPTAAAD